jgi:hypothetical protein
MSARKRVALSFLVTSLALLAFLRGGGAGPAADEPLEQQHHRNQLRGYQRRGQQHRRRGQRVQQHHRPQRMVSYLRLWFY